MIRVKEVINLNSENLFISLSHDVQYNKSAGSLPEAVQPDHS